MAHTSINKGFRWNGYGGDMGCQWGGGAGACHHWQWGVARKVRGRQHLANQRMKAWALSAVARGGGSMVVMGGLAVKGGSPMERLHNEEDQWWWGVDHQWRLGIQGREREIERSEVMFFFFFHKDLLWCFLSVVIGLSQNNPYCGTFKCHNRSVIFVFNISGSTYCGAF